MLRFVQLFVLVAVMIVSSQAGDGAAIMEAAQKCAETFKATPADMEALQKHSTDLTKEAKCVMSCVMQHFKLLSADGKLMKDVYMQEAEGHAKGDAAMMASAVEIYDKCQGQGDADICEAAYKYGVCMKDEMTARGMTIDW